MKTYTHEEIETLLAGTTEGEWYHHKWDAMGRPHVIAESLIGSEEVCKGQADMPRTHKDADFIAASKSIVRQLLDENKRLKEGK